MTEKSKQKFDFPTFGSDDLAELVAAGTVIDGDPEAVRRLVANTHVPAPAPEHHTAQDAG